MKMITDARSNKVVHESSSSSSNAELVWWFGKTNEQYRVRGELVYVGDDAVTATTTTERRNINDAGRDDVSLLLARARQEQWANLSDKAREQFYWPEPGLPYGSGEASSLPIGGRDETGRLLPPPPTFLLVLLRPRRCEYLRLTDNYRQIDELVVTKPFGVGGTGARGTGEDGMWTMQRVNP
jgi:pyridoxamine 5'-phosphate oxidase